MNTTFKIIQKSDFTKKDGTRNIFLRFTLNRQTKYFPLNVYVMPKHFKNDKVLHADPEYYKKNLLIEHALNKANNIDFDYKVNDKKITFESFDRDFSNRNYGSKSFYAFVD
ncbi:MAG: hypothetical protein H8D45_18735, partial [Bacteroidetes bacterium]|nr:hypothetical protein [Bacteroidota bacterium]